jgi:hypothetical protein
MRPQGEPFHFAIGEWATCPRCGFVCDDPFRPAGSEVDEPELVLGQSLPPEFVRQAELSVKVFAICPRCGDMLQAEATFRFGKFVRFSDAAVA